MNPEHYNEFLSRKARGDREGARRSIRLFCDSFTSLGEMALWTRSFLESAAFRHPIRHELYVNVILPVLSHGYRKKDLWSTLWLAKTCQNLYNAKDLHATLGRPSDFSLLHECYRIDPSHAEVREALLDALVRWFEYCIHEWPSGVLFGSDGATHNQCKEILSELALARELDTANRFSELFDDVEQKTNSCISDFESIE